jgi:hypothetical protein
VGGRSNKGGTIEDRFPDRSGPIEHQINRLMAYPQVAKEDRSIGSCSNLRRYLNNHLLTTLLTPDAETIA